MPFQVSDFLNLDQVNLSVSSFSNQTYGGLLPPIVESSPCIDSYIGLSQSQPASYYYTINDSVGKVSTYNARAIHINFDEYAVYFNGIKLNLKKDPTGLVTIEVEKNNQVKSVIIDRNERQKRKLKL